MHEKTSDFFQYRFHVDIDLKTIDAYFCNLPVFIVGIYILLLDI